jgi:hypothetical protein
VGIEEDDLAKKLRYLRLGFEAMASMRDDVVSWSLRFVGAVRVSTHCVWSGKPAGSSRW